MNELHIDIELRLHKNYWGLGYGSEIGTAILDWAFSKKITNRIIGVARPDNLASRRTLKKIGMHYKGTIQCKNILYSCYEALLEDFHFEGI